MQGSETSSARRCGPAAGGAAVTREGRTATPKKTPRSIAIDLDLCKACGICVSLCPQSVFDSDALGQPVVARLDDCISCSFCERHCPDFAIEIDYAPRRAPAGRKGRS